MFSGTIFTRAAQPPEDVRLPRSCWAFYHQVDGSSTVAAIAYDLDLSEAETFAAIRLLQSYDLVEEKTLTYAEFRHSADGAPDTSSSATADPTPDDASSAPDHGTASGDGVMPSDPEPTDATEEGGPETGNYSTQSIETPSFASGSGSSDTQTQSVPALDLPSFWEWLKSKSGNVKNYKNTQAFILMEASTALASIGITSMDELEAMERCDDPDVVAALESAVENNLNESIPESCYN
jgi:hypothetical protein